MAEKRQLFEQLFIRNRGRIYMFAEAFVPRNEVQDFEQEIWLQVWRSLDAFQEQGDFKKWLYGVAFNTLRDFNRKQKQQEISLDDLATEPPCQEQHREGVLVVGKFLRTLGQTDRAVMLMHIGGCEYREIAEVTGSQESTLRVHVHRLKQQLREFMEGGHGYRTAHDRVERTEV